MNSPGARNTELDEMIISVGADGRVYFHDLDPEMIQVALAVNPDDVLMRQRLAVCEAWRSRLAAAKDRAEAKDHADGTLAPTGGHEEPR